MSAIPRMKTIAETAEATGLSQCHIRHLCKSGQVVHVRAGSKYLVNLDKLIDFLNGETVPQVVEQGKIRRIS